MRSAATLLLGLALALAGAAGASAQPLLGWQPTLTAAPAPAHVGKRVRLVVRFARHADAAARRAALEEAGARPVRTLRHLGYTVISVPSAAAPGAVASLRASGVASYAARDGVVHAVLTPNDPLYNGSASPCVSSLGCWSYANLNVAQAWDATKGSSSVTVAVIDTGVDAAHPDLAGAVLPGYNVVAGTTDTTDDNGHGTEVAGVIAARIDNGIGVPGVCGNCKILPVKVLDSAGSGSTSNIASGITWAADHGANVINLSLAGTTADPAMSSAISYAIGKGITVVAAAGNAGSNSPTTCANGSCGGYPGAFTSSITSGLISVGAADYYDALYSFSNHGSWVLVAAPGAAVTPTKDGGYNNPGGAAGTSIASPFVAGVAALALSYNPALTPAQIQNAIVSTARTTPTVDVQYGHVDAGAVLRAVGYVPTTVAPGNTVLPTLTGTARDGQTITASSGTWTGTPAPTYATSIQRCDADGSSHCAQAAASSTYRLASGDVGHAFRAVVTATNSAGSASATSTATGVVAALAPSLTGTIDLSGTAVDGGTLSTSAGASAFSGTAPLTVTRAWYRCDGSGNGCVATGGTSTTLALSPSDVGQTFKVTTTASNSAGSASGTSALSAVVAAAAPVATVAPAIAGTAQVGSTLTAAGGAWTGTAPISSTYAWEACDADGSSNCATIAGATGLSFTPAATQVGRTLVFAETAHNAGGDTTSRASATVPVTAAAGTGGGGTTGGGSSSGGSGTTGGGSNSSGGGGGGAAIPPDVVVSVSAGSATVKLGETVTYYATVQSRNLGAATNLHLLASLPEGAQLVSSYANRGSGCSQNGTTVDCDLDWISPPIQAQVRLVVSFTHAGAVTVPFSDRQWEKDVNPADNSTLTTTTIVDPAAPQQAPAPPAAPVPTPAAPGNLGAVPLVTVRGATRTTAAVGTQLRAVAPASAGGVRYQWQVRSGKVWHPIRGQSKPRLTVTSRYAGASIRVVVTLRSGRTTLHVASKPLTVRAHRRR